MNKILYFLKIPKAAVGFFILLFFILIAIFAPLIAPYQANQNRYIFKKAPAKLEKALYEKKIYKKLNDEAKELFQNCYEKTDNGNFYILKKGVTCGQKDQIVVTLSKIKVNFGLREDPSLKHFLGTDANGYDIFSRIILGSQYSLLVGIICGILAGTIALIMGLTAGYFGGITDDILSMIINIFLVIPGFPLMIVLAAFIPVKGVLVIILILAFTSWSYGARLFRSQVLTLRTRDFVMASIVIGERPFRIIFTDILPNMLSLIIANFFATCLASILGEAGLEFIGLGDSSIVTWGTVLFWAQNGDAFINKQWLWIVVPGLCIALVGTSFALLNYAVDEIANPRLRTLKSIKLKGNKA